MSITQPLTLKASVQYAQNIVKNTSDEESPWSSNQLWSIGLGSLAATLLPLLGPIALLLSAGMLYWTPVYLLPSINTIVERTTRAEAEEEDVIASQTRKIETLELKRKQLLQATRGLGMSLRLARRENRAVDDDVEFADVNTALDLLPYMRERLRSINEDVIWLTQNRQQRHGWLQCVEEGKQRISQSNQRDGIALAVQEVRSKKLGHTGKGRR